MINDIRFMIQENNMNIAINGFGRIGRTTLKAGLTKKGFNVVAVNDLTDTRTLAHLLKYDTAYGPYEKKVNYDERHLIIGGKKISVFAEKDPAKLPWKKLKIDVVLECTGIFRTAESAGAHLRAGAKRVIISAPAKGGNVGTFILGVNDERYQGEKIINNASCTTNCIAPVAGVMMDIFGVKKAIMTTMHGYTADQNLQDGPHNDLRRARAAAVNIVPTTTGAAISTTETLPELKGLFDGLALRVPVPVGSLADFTFVVARPVTVEAVNRAFLRAAKLPRYRGIIAVTDEPLVSADIVGRTESAIVDMGLTKVVDGDLVKVVAWYDNELGYSHRLAEMALTVGKTLK